MHFIGIIAQNKATVQEIVNYFLAKDKYSILFICQSMDEYKQLPAQNRKKADIVFVDTGENYFELVQHLKYLKSINFHYHIVLLSSPQLPRAGTIGFIDKNHIKLTLESCFTAELNARFVEHNNHHPAEPERVAPFLTNRETEIAELVLKGHTNKKIGELLYISTCTVNAHLRKIFSKLSVKSRTELAYKMINM
jgi:DNA-binding CsgD family transcriptional regulator